jgi:hypothetical protein
MGVFLSTEEEASLRNGCYDTKNCLPGCLEKCLIEGTGSLHEGALGKAHFMRKALFIREAIHSSLQNADVTDLILRLFLHCCVEERVARSLTLPKPWRVARHYSRDSVMVLLLPPYCSVYRDKAKIYCIIHHHGEELMVPSSFWLDDVYDSIECECPPRKAHLRHEAEKRKQPFL